MKLKYLIVMCLIVNNDSFDEGTEKESLVSCFNTEDWSSLNEDRLTCSLNTEDRSVSNKPAPDLETLTESEEDEADKVTEKIWDLTHIEGGHYMSTERLFAVTVPKVYHPILKGWIEENPGIVNPLSKNNFMLLLQATIPLLNLKEILSEIH